LKIDDHHLMCMETKMDFLKQSLYQYQLYFIFELDGSKLDMLK